MSWTTGRKSWALPVQSVSPARSNAYLWLWINLLVFFFFPQKLSSRGNFKILPFHCDCEWVLVLFQFPWQQKNLVSDCVWIQKSNFPGLFWIRQFPFLSPQVFWSLVLNPLTPFSSAKSNLFLLSQDRLVFSHTFFIFLYNLIQCADSRNIATFYT